MSAKSARVKKLALLAMFTAIGAVLITLVHFPLFPAAPFLQYDPADVPILIAAFAFGPVAGILVTVLASFIQAFFLGGDGIYGFLMHVIATGILVTVASTLYRKFHTRTGAIIGLLLGTFAMGVGMMIANHFITPFYMGAPTEMVDAMLVTVILPFNLLKAGINLLSPSWSTSLCPSTSSTARSLPRPPRRPPARSEQIPNAPRSQRGAGRSAIPRYEPGRH